MREDKILDRLISRNIHLGRDGKYIFLKKEWDWLSPEEQEIVAEYAEFRLNQEGISADFVLLLSPTEFNDLEVVKIDFAELKNKRDFASKVPRAIDHYW